VAFSARLRFDGRRLDGAADLQPRFDPVATTVARSRAGRDDGGDDATFVVVGICYIVTALALRSARTTGGWS